MKLKILIWLLVIALLLFFGRHSASYEQPTYYPEITYLQVNPYEIKTYARLRVSAYFGANQWVYMDDLITRESNWNHLAQNKTSSAFGLCQFLQATWKNGKTFDPYRQIEECIVYVKDKYGNPQKAIIYHNRFNHY